MKHFIYIAALFLLSNSFLAQTFHKQYSSYNMSNARMNVSNGRIYLAYCEDSANLNIKKYLVIQKNDISGNVLWRKKYQSSYFSNSSTNQVVKILNNSSQLIIGMEGGNTSTCVALINVDTTQGSLNYINTYAIGTPSAGISIKDMCIANGQVFSVGNLGTSLYVLRTTASNGQIINQQTNLSGSLFGLGVACRNTALYITGYTGNNYPFLAKFAVIPGSINLTSIKEFTTGFNPGANFRNVDVTTNGRLSILATSSGTNEATLVLSGDTAVSNAFTYTLAGNNHVSIQRFNDLKTYGSKTYLSADDFVYTFTNVISPPSVTTYSPINITRSRISIYNNQTYYLNSLFGSFTTFSPNIIKGDSVGTTPCSGILTPSMVAVSYTGQTSNLVLSLTGTSVSLSSAPVSLTTTVIDKCIATGINQVNTVEGLMLVKNSDDAFIVESTNSVINSYRIFDMSGKVVEAVQNTQTNSIIINKSGLNAGVYFVTMYTENHLPVTLKLLCN